MRTCCVALALAVLLTGCASTPSSDAKAIRQPTAADKAKVEKALGAFAKQIRAKPMDPATDHRRLEEYLKKNPGVFGAAFCYAPTKDSGGKGWRAPYVYRSGSGFSTANMSDLDEVYVGREWYDEPVRLGKPHWSKPYFDKEGGKVWMITLSVPVYGKGAKKDLLGVVTSDLRLPGKPG